MRPAAAHNWPAIVATRTHPPDRGTGGNARYESGANGGNGGNDGSNNDDDDDIDDATTCPYLAPEVERKRRAECASKRPSNTHTHTHTRACTVAQFSHEDHIFGGVENVFDALRSSVNNVTFGRFSFPLYYISRRKIKTTLHILVRNAAIGTHRKDPTPTASYVVVLGCSRQFLRRFRFT